MENDAATGEQCRRRQQMQPATPCSDAAESVDDMQNFDLSTSET